MNPQTTQPLAMPLTFGHATAALAEGLRAIASGQHIIDLGKVTQVDSSAVAVLLAWQRAALAAAVPLEFVNAPASLASLAALYGVADLLKVSAPGNSRTDLPHH